MAMSNLTQKQIAYIEARANGVKQEPAAIAAGYSAHTAGKQASLMERQEHIKKALAAAKRRLRAQSKSDGVDMPDEMEVDPRNKMPKAKYTDSKEFLVDVMNHRLLPLAMRADAANKLLPYQHSRLGEAGKKEQKTNRAHEIAGTGGKVAKAKYAPKHAPPALRVMQGGKS